MENFPSKLELAPVTNVLSVVFNNTAEAENAGSLVSSSITVPLTVTFCAHEHTLHTHSIKASTFLFFILYLH